MGRTIRVTGATPKRAVHYQALDGLRGIAVLAVVGYHLGLDVLGGGYLGVDVFFVISGFVVGRNLLRLMTGPGWARTFFGRRTARLYPVLAAFTAAQALWWLLGAEADGSRTAALFGAALMSFNLAAVHTGATLDGTLHLWSLGVEWHFYLAAPFLLLAVSGWPARRQAATFGALAAAVAALRLGLLLAGVDSLSVYLHTVTRLDGLLIGLALATVPPELLPRRTTRLGAPAVAILVALVLVAPPWSVRPPITLGLVSPATTALVAVVVAAVVVANDQSQGLGRAADAVLGSPVLLWAGQRSYSIYVWHYLIGVTILAGGSESWQGWATFAAQVALSLAAAEVSFRVTERPARARLIGVLAPGP